jgi:ADP-heptose:LPS heptosyltransferase
MSALPASHQPVESVSIKPWKAEHLPRKILVIRIQALGDLFACLPVLSALKNKHPEITLDLLCREDFAELPEALGLFHKVYKLKGGISGKKQAWHSLRLSPYLKSQGYDMVLDLQRNKSSRLLRKLLRPKAYTEFDRYSSFSPLLRNRWSVEQAGFPELEANYDFIQAFQPSESALDKLAQAGWQAAQKLIILNPAGFSVTRNWPLEKYIAFIDQFSAKDPQLRFLILGVAKLKEKAQYLQSQRPDVVIDLTGQTTLREMYTLLLRSELVLTEDSGLGHIAWLSGINTVMLLGSTRKDWASPLGAHTACFDSSHLACGNCMQMECPLGTIACMQDLLVERVVESAWNLCGQSVIERIPDPT